MSNKLRILSCTIFTIIGVSGTAWANKVNSDQARSLSQLSTPNSDLGRAASQYKASVQALIPIYENNLKTAMEALVKRKELFAQGLVSKRDIDAGEQAVKEAQTQLDQTRQQLTESDQLIAEVTAESIKPPRKDATRVTPQ